MAAGRTAPPASATSGSSATPSETPACRSPEPPTRPTCPWAATSVTRSACRRRPPTPAARALPRPPPPQPWWCRRCRRTHRLRPSAGPPSRARPSPSLMAAGRTNQPATPTSGSSATAPATTARASPAPPNRPTKWRPPTWATRSACRRRPPTPAARAPPRARRPQRSSPPRCR